MTCWSSQLHCDVITIEDWNLCNILLVLTFQFAIYWNALILDITISDFYFFLTLVEFLCIVMLLGCLSSHPCGDWNMNRESMWRGSTLKQWLYDSLRGTPIATTLLQNNLKSLFQICFFVWKQLCKKLSMVRLFVMHLHDEFLWVAQCGKHPQVIATQFLFLMYSVGNWVFTIITQFTVPRRA